jgi:TPR repeat protein
MIAKRVPLLIFLLCTLLTLPSAWAQEPAVEDFSAMDAEVESGVQAYRAGEYVRAKEILLPLAERGHPKAMNMVGLMHDGTGVFPSDPITKCDWYERAAQAGYAPGMNNLGRCFLQGEGRPLDIQASRQWFTKAAEKGALRAMLYLGGLNGVPPDEQRYWLKKAADQGSRVAAANLWLNGQREDAPDFTLLDELCVMVRIMLLKQGVTVCDD